MLEQERGKWGKFGQDRVFFALFGSDFLDERNNTWWKIPSRKDSVHDEKVGAAGEKRVAGRLSWQNRERVRPSEGVKMIHPQEPAGKAECVHAQTQVGGLRW